MYKMNDAKRDFSNGFLKKFRIEKNPMGLGWLIFLGEGKTSGHLVDARLKQPRNFKTLDAAINSIEEIGFQVISLSPQTA